uniref:Putative chitinase-like lectin n=1 Tax=Ixodes ricinus TaxID=34613 RepID=A0A090XFE2_IXORI
MTTKWTPSLILQQDLSMRALSSAIVTLVLAAIACNASAQRTPRQKVLLCYWASWSHYRVGNGKFSAKQMESTPCTHLIYAYAKVVSGVIAPVDPNLDIQGNGMYRQFNALKRTNRDPKTLISVGGWKEGSQKFSKIASSQRGRQTFADSVESFLERHGFDGIDIDWRYPTQRGGSWEDKKNFALLLEDLRETLDKKRHILTVTVSGLKHTISEAYDVSELSKHVDFMSVTAFDLFGPWNSFTGHPAPLRGIADDSSDTLNVETSIENWISEGVDVSKLVLGMPLYGRTYTLEDPSEHGFNAPTSGPGKPGTLHQGSGDAWLQRDLHAPLFSWLGLDAEP